MRKIKLLIMTVVASLMVSSCGTTSTVPITGRKHSLLVSDAQVLSLSNQQYTELMKKMTLSSNASQTAMVKRVGQKLATAVENYLRNNGAAADLQNYAWAFSLVDKKEANAFCMPGGKIVVYEGLLPYTQNETGLAIVLGHEIAHAVAKHSAEQMSKQMRQQYGTQILGSVLNSAVGSGVGDIAAMAAQTGFSFANLKYSRENEHEADHIGLIFAAMAGYNPQEAIPFWKRMSTGNQNTNDRFSDHPSDAKRIAALQALMPEAMKYYQATQPATPTQRTTTKTRRTTRR